MFPNVTTALRILLTAPITVASAERSFSKLKLIIKTFLRSTMSEDRLESLALISIEHNIAATLEYGTLIDLFSAIKGRKIAFVHVLVHVYVDLFGMSFLNIYSCLGGACRYSYLYYLYSCNSICNIKRLLELVIE